ncbi:tRNA pseudouridine(55) synthase TruB [Patescibacteria group bacterium]|nr:tRNA pseudouridine(55) synthase TruB [Patescibacteria group bacterium]
MLGFFLINKPKGITSHDVVGYLRRITGEKTIGHAGTLDPLAEGLMIVAIGREFTKRISEFSKLDKEYMAEATLGAISTTYDAEGDITPSNLPLVRGGEVGLPTPQEEDVMEVLQGFVGKQGQMPPIYSAKKIKGQKAYNLARQGKAVELVPVPINIYEIKLLNYRYPLLKFSVKVSSGTYIRSLVHDLGQKLGVGAYMSGLIRTTVGDYKLEQAIDLYQIKSVVDLHLVI